MTNPVGDASSDGSEKDGPSYRAGLVGAGMISEHHLAALQGLPAVSLVGLHDADRQRARARAAEWSTTAYESVEALVAAGANVIHVLTPPDTHAQVALEALELGCHVLVEKPLAESEADARRIGEVAATRGLVATVNHSLLYDPQVLAAREQVRAGALGEIVGVDVFRSWQYPEYEGGPLPPHMRRAAYPWWDVGVHCLYLIGDLLGRVVEVEAEWASLGGDRNLAFDEWRGLVRCEGGLGQFQLSLNEKPPGSQLLIHGSRGVLRLDLFAMFRSRRAATPLPKAAERVLNAYSESLRPLVEVPVNAWRFVRGEIHPYQGLRNLIADFYARLEAGMPPPVATEDAADLIDHLEGVARAAEADHERTVERFRTSPTTEFLVTGASGSLGSAVVRRLVAAGHTVRAFVRQPPERPQEGVEYALGNLGDPDAVERAVRGAEVVVHAGAAMAGAWPEHLGSTVIGARNVVAACERHEVSQLVQISSLSVVQWAGASAQRPIDEVTPLEPFPERRGPYTQAKLQAERTVSAAAAEGLPCVILRPGAIFGGGIPLLGPGIARNVGRRSLILGSGQLAIPLIYIDDVVDAIEAAIERRLVSGEIIQIIDDERLTQNEILREAGAAGDGVLRVPRGAVFALGRLSEYLFAKLGRPSPLGSYRLNSALAEVAFASDRAEQLLGWRPRVGAREGIRRVCS